MLLCAGLSLKPIAIIAHCIALSLTTFYYRPPTSIIAHYSPLTSRISFIRQCFGVPAYHWHLSLLSLTVSHPPSLTTFYYRPPNCIIAHCPSLISYSLFQRKGFATPAYHWHLSLLSPTKSHYRSLHYHRPPNSTIAHYPSLISYSLFQRKGFGTTAYHWHLPLSSPTVSHYRPLNSIIAHLTPLSPTTAL